MDVKVDVSLYPYLFDSMPKCLQNAQNRAHKTQISPTILKRKIENQYQMTFVYS